MAELEMGKDGFPLVTEESSDSPWWLPLLGIVVIAVAVSWVALTLTGAPDTPQSVTVKIVPPAAEE